MRRLADLFILTGDRDALVAPHPLNAAWATDVTAIPPDLPVRYTLRSRGCPGAVAGDAYNGWLVSRLLGEELQRIASGRITTLPAVIEGIPDHCGEQEYVLLRAASVVPFDAVHDAGGAPVFATRLGVDYLVVSADARQQLERAGFPPEHFGEMLFAA